jgi:hypothetical protein
MNRKPVFENYEIIADNDVKIKRLNAGLICLMNWDYFLKHQEPDRQQQQLYMISGQLSFFFNLTQKTNHV